MPAGAPRLGGNRIGQGDHILHLAGEAVRLAIAAQAPPPAVGGVDGELAFQMRYHPAKALMIVANPMHQDQGCAAPASLGADAGSVRGGNLEAIVHYYWSRLAG
jgi:hypothetical protein